MEKFTSKIDMWLLVILLVTIVVSMVSGFLLIKESGIQGYLSGLILIVIGAVLPMWLLLGTKYTVTNEDLIVRAGPMLWKIPIASISSVRETRNSRSSPALSLDRLRLNYGNGKSIMVSPKDKNRFRSAIGFGYAED